MTDAQLTKALSRLSRVRSADEQPETKIHIAADGPFLVTGPDGHARHVVVDESGNMETKMAVGFDSNLETTEKT